MGSRHFHSQRKHSFVVSEAPTSYTGRGGEIFCNGFPGLLQKLLIPAKVSCDKRPRMLLQSGDKSGCPGVDVSNFTRVSTTCDGVRIFVPTVSLFAFSSHFTASGVHMLATIDVQRLNAEEKGGNGRLGNK